MMKLILIFLTLFFAVNLYALNAKEQQILLEHVKKTKLDSRKALSKRIAHYKQSKNIRSSSSKRTLKGAKNKKRMKQRLQKERLRKSRRVQ